MNQKLTPQQIAPYIGTGLKAKMNIFGDNDTIVEVAGIKENYGDEVLISGLRKTVDEWFETDMIKPILYNPSTHLTKTIIDSEGKEIVPILELSKIAFPHREFKVENSVFAKDKYGLRFHYADNGFHCFSGGEEWYLHNQLALFQQLYKWHFALDIDESLYLDKASLTPPVIGDKK